MTRFFWCRGSDEEIWNEIMKEASEALTRRNILGKHRTANPERKLLTAMAPVLGLQTPLQRKPKNMKHKLLASISAMNLRWISMVEATLDWLKK